MTGPEPAQQGTAGVYDTLDAHLTATSDLAHAATPMGMLLAWAVNNHLVSGELVQAHEQLVLRIRFGEARGSELLVAAGGDLAVDHFNVDGREFLDRYYAGFMDDFRELFGEDCYAVADNLDNYQKVAQLLTGRFMASAGRRKPGPGALTRLIDGLRRWLN